ncbi:hypothetical protein CVT26_012141 [Gymnopilus dilepis]|uniref:Uncharacterized protein n=1 Tax=Gymnopilus dilepis TaxID=231916 RepID=A0A409W5P2_9AGAR|nr:hypothetical protein CVT26_012141 [Gymnopilus dilepis]
MTLSSPPPCVSEVLEGQLFLGNLPCALDAELRRRLSITHILSVCPDFPSSGPNHMNVPVEDSEYENLLMHLPLACNFIKGALSNGGRILVHCVMGISRSATVVAAYLMQSRNMTAHEALNFVKKVRPQAHPNYGFVKQLDVFRKCDFQPDVAHPAYRSWKRRYQQDVTYYLNHAADTVSIIEDKLLLTNDFPSDVQQAQWYLLDLRITHLVSISPTEICSTSSVVQHRHFNVDSHTPEALLEVLPAIAACVHDAIESGGLVLVHSLMESRACTAVCAYLMGSKNKSPEEAFSAVMDALPLFNPTKSFMETLESFRSQACGPSAGRLVGKDRLLPQGKSSGSGSVSKPVLADQSKIERSRPLSGLSSY